MQTPLTVRDGPGKGPVAFSHGSLIRAGPWAHGTRGPTLGILNTHSYIKLLEVGSFSSSKLGYLASRNWDI